MKKSLIALAVLAASGVASAQSTVTLYGLADVYVGSQKSKVTRAGVTTNSPRQTVVNSGGFNTSRFGMKGSEDLGGGLKANFLLEAGYDIDTGAANNYVSPFNFDANGDAVESNAIFGRQSWVGLSGGFGEIRLGKMWTPYDEVKGTGAGAFDANIFAPANNVWLSNNYRDRPGNSIYYSTPSFSGFSAAGSYSFGENKTNATAGPPPAGAVDAGGIASVNVQYANGPVGVALSHQQEKTPNDNATAKKLTQLNGSFDFRVVKVLAAYGEVENGTTDLFAVTPAGFTVDKSREYQIGVDVPLGPVVVSGGYAHSKATLAAGGGEIKSNGIGLAAKYNLSKRTFVYTGLQFSENKLAGNEIKNDTFALGVQHKF